MNKAEWEEAYNEFDKAYTELSEHERNYKFGSNKKIREKANRQMGYVKHRIEYLFNKYPAVYILATGGENSSGYSKAIVMDEFFQNRYIVGDVSNLLGLIREKIKSFDV